MPRQPHEQPSFSPHPPPITTSVLAGGVCGGCAVCGGEFKEVPPLFKIRCWEGGALCGLGRTPGLFSKGLPPTPIPSSCRPSVPPGLLSEGGVSPALPLALPTPFPGAREEDWGSRLFLGNVSRCRRPRTLPGYHVCSPCPADPFLAVRFHPAFPCRFPGRLGA